MSCIASSWRWCNIFRDRSLTLFKNDIDLREKFDSVAVLESISSSMTNLTSTGLPVLVCCTLDELRCTFRLSDLVFTGLSDAVEASTFGSLTLHRETEFIVGFYFAVTLSSLASSCVLFDITSRLLMELKMADVEQTKKDSTRHVWNFPWSACLRVGFWCQCIWFGSWNPNWFYQTTNQEQLWDIETPIIVGLLPFIIIFITAWVSSNTCNKASWWEEWTFEGIKSTLSRSSIIPWDSFVFELCEVLNELHVGSYTSLTVLDYSDSCFQELWRSDPINQMRVDHPTSILHPKEWFLILLNCAKLKFVSYTSNWLEHMYDFPKSTMFHLM